ncbi:hypothetical protein [Pseudomonas gingeri]|uniref:Uncharacterized protein n=1 Tax=Pseudomonas gingeri TaxID=117681 RepID=A0A7Y7YA19_9PSED|nr:hypothetical protein [Pseudomonas gingeri]NWB26859.1 hypothetical protein [Pseudomonas gingeri]NWC32591.1 hypothetical protein [Pseudomonas gingeri]NWD05113.1 hypothetical protein [Pseudomonas gingeri]NWD46568.1 hypothetical protein [Pseudomonas gingeri]NWE36475.1 hypothetical protein [Pseudomonas gingeri]
MKDRQGMRNFMWRLKVDVTYKSLMGRVAATGQRQTPVSAENKQQGGSV